MRCIYCNYNSKLEERRKAHGCPTCGKKIAFEPTAAPKHITDRQFQAAINRCQALRRDPDAPDQIHLPSPVLRTQSVHTEVRRRVGVHRISPPHGYLHHGSHNLMHVLDGGERNAFLVLAGNRRDVGCDFSCHVGCRPEDI